MSLSIFTLFSIGIGPSSSHTVGPMKAAREFTKLLDPKSVEHVQVELFGSLAFTGKGHGTDAAILMGLENETPALIDPDTIPLRFETILRENTLKLGGVSSIPFHYQKDFIFNFKDLLPLHTNGMRFTSFNSKGDVIVSKIFYSIGGGFIIDEHPPQKVEHSVPFPFANTKELLKQCREHGLSIDELMLANESSLLDKSEVMTSLYNISKIMRACIDKGCQTTGILPGGLNVPRRAAPLFTQLKAKGMPKSFEYTDSMNWLNLYAIAVNEENAAGSRVVTAPTNGAAGVIPAVLHYYLDFYPEAKPYDAIRFLLTAGAIAMLCKMGASISGAEVGCQGEVGSACAMAAGALTAVLGGTIDQVENAAEIAMEHHLGMTCDPINGLVQIPCIERNAMGAVKAVNASRLALFGDGKHFVSLDKAIATMKQTGKDMLSIYKETSQGGLAANITEC